MERIALQKLIDWDKDKRKKPLIVWGARQVGKTYLVKEIFAETYYKNNYIYIDCKKEDEIREFCSETANAEKIIEYISLRKGKQINEKTLLVPWCVLNFKEKHIKEVQMKMTSFFFRQEKLIRLRFIP